MVLAYGNELGLISTTNQRIIICSVCVGSWKWSNSRMVCIFEITVKLEILAEINFH